MSNPPLPRPTPDDPAGLSMAHLTLGLSVLIGAAWLYGGTAEDVASGDPLTVIDKHVAAWFDERQTPDLTIAMQLVTGLAAPAWVTAVAVIAALGLCWKRCWYWLLALVLALPGGMVLGWLLKLACQRQQPGFAGATQVFNGCGFPSGHTMAATLLYGTLAAFAVNARNGWRWRARAILGACLIVLLVGLSRVYLGAHVLSDVLGAAAAALAWMGLCLTAVEELRQSRCRVVG